MSDEEPEAAVATSSMGPDELRHAELSARLLDDEADRQELRQRYYGLLQELRVVLPGVQVLVAFLLTVPFASGFEELDDTGRTLYGVAMGAGVTAVIALLTPTVFHRVAERTRRSARLTWGIRVTVAGIALVGLSLLTALACVTRFVFGDATALVVTGLALAALLGLWVVLPLMAGRWDRPPIHLSHDAPPPGDQSPAANRSADGPRS